jgi:hypothetical protein
MATGSVISRVRNLCIISYILILACINLFQSSSVLLFVSQESKKGWNILMVLEWRRSGCHRFTNRQWRIMATTYPISKMLTLSLERWRISILSSTKWIQEVISHMQAKSCFAPSCSAWFLVSRYEAHHGFRCESHERPTRMVSEERRACPSLHRLLCLVGSSAWFSRQTSQQLGNSVALHLPLSFLHFSVS